MPKPPGPEQEQGSNSAQDHAVKAPCISPPEAGGAIQRIGEKWSVNPVTGTATLSIPIFARPGRSDFGPKLAPTHDCGTGYGPFGFGWRLGIPAIARKTSKGLPQYRDEDESDVFLVSDAEDLLPELICEHARRTRNDRVQEREELPAGRRFCDRHRGDNQPNLHLERLLYGDRTPYLQQPETRDIDFDADPAAGLFEPFSDYVKHRGLGGAPLADAVWSVREKRLALLTQPSSARIWGQCE